MAEGWIDRARARGYTNFQKAPQVQCEPLF
jgi:hypothetical protein